MQRAAKQMMAIWTMALAATLAAGGAHAQDSMRSQPLGIPVPYPPALPTLRTERPPVPTLHARIRAVAAEEGFAPATALALIAIESSFDTAAVGRNGPLGLMQVKHGTAASVMPGITRAQLFDPETNVRVGLRYLRGLMGRYNGDLETALRAYKGGPRKVDTGKGRDPATNSYIKRFRAAEARFAIAYPSAAAAPPER